MFPVRKCKHRREKKDRLANQVRCSPGHRKVVNTYQEELSTVLKHRLGAHLRVLLGQCLAGSEEL